MDRLDFSGLTDDQLVELARACCLEAARRSPAAEAAMRSMMIDEAERIRIAKAAVETEIAAARARERERIAQEAAARVRAGEAARRAEEDARYAQERQASAAAAAAKAAAEAKAKAAAKAAERMAWLRRFADHLGLDPANIIVGLTRTKFGYRVLVNEGDDRFARNHLLDYNVETGEIRTVQAYVKRKPDFAALAAEFATTYTPYDVWMCGANYDWSATA